MKGTRVGLKTEFEDSEDEGEGVRLPSVEGEVVSIGMEDARLQVVGQLPVTDRQNIPNGDVWK